MLKKITEYFSRMAQTMIEIQTMRASRIVKSLESKPL